MIKLVNNRDVFYKNTRKIVYNETDTCDNCRELGISTKLIPGKAVREKCKNGFHTGRWLCTKCYGKIHYHNFGKYDPDNQWNSLRRVVNCRTGNLDRNCSTAKGTKSQKLACILYGWEDLNEKNDNYKVPIDCFDSKTGLYYQVQGHNYNSLEGLWSFTHFDREWKKKYKSMVCFCLSEDGKIVERIYIFPKEEIDKRTIIGVYKSSADRWGNQKIHWYEQYKVKDEELLKRANYIWKEIIQ